MIMASSREAVFYVEINKFRYSPIEYMDTYNVPVACTSPLDKSYKPLSISSDLESSSAFQASTMSLNECSEITHDTCDLYCDRFPSCSYLDRISSFLSGENHDNITEILTKGPNNPYHVFHWFLASEGHCEHMISPDVNSMGANFTRIDKNIFVVDFAYIF